MFVFAEKFLDFAVIRINKWVFKLIMRLFELSAKMGSLSVFFNFLSAKTRPLSAFYLFMENYTKKVEENQISSTFIIKITIFIDYFFTMGQFPQD